MAKTSLKSYGRRKLMGKTKFKILAISFLMLLGFFGLAKTSLAVTPAISNVSGTVATGQTLTITGTNMMDEDKVNWDTFFTTHPTAYGFEGTSPGTAGQCDGDCYCDLGPCYGVYDTNVKLLGNKSMDFHVQGYSDISNGCGVDCKGAYNIYNFQSMGSDVYYRWYTRFDSAGGEWPDSVIKHFYPYPTNPYYFQFTGGASLPSTFVWGNSEIGSPNYVNLPRGQLQLGRWYCVELHGNTNTNKIDIWIDGFQVVNNQDQSGSVSVTALRFGVVNEGNSSASFDMHNYWDGLVDSSSRIYPSSTIEIANSSNYSTATKVYQEPLYLSDGSVQIKSDLAGLGSGPYYLFVTNNRQETSAAYNLSGDGGDTTPPSAPMGLSVQ